MVTYVQLLLMAPKALTQTIPLPFWQYPPILQLISPLPSVLTAEIQRMAPVGLPQMIWLPPNLRFLDPYRLSSVRLLPPVSIVQLLLMAPWPPD